MKHLLAAALAVFLCLPVYAQSPDLGTVDYLRHDARTGQTNGLGWTRAAWPMLGCLG